MDYLLIIAFFYSPHLGKVNSVNLELANEAVPIVSTDLPSYSKRDDIHTVTDRPIGTVTKK